MKGKSIRNEDVQRLRKANKAAKRKAKKTKAIDRKNKRKWQAHG